MKKNIILARVRKRQHEGDQGRPMTIGMDLGDKNEPLLHVGRERRSGARKPAWGRLRRVLRRSSQRCQPCRVAMEVGTHSPWVSRLLKSFGHEVIVANARQVQLISQSSRKDDRWMREMLARLARVDPRLLRPIQHRSEQAQADLRVIRVRAALVEARTVLVNTARGLTKSSGSGCRVATPIRWAWSRWRRCRQGCRAALQPLLEDVESLTEKIQALDRTTRADRPGTTIRKPPPEASQRSG